MSIEICAGLGSAMELQPLMQQTRKSFQYRAQVEEGKSFFALQARPAWPSHRPQVGQHFPTPGKPLNDTRRILTDMICFILSTPCPILPKLQGDRGLTDPPPSRFSCVALCSFKQRWNSTGIATASKSLVLQSRVFLTRPRLTPSTERLCQNCARLGRVAGLSCEFVGLNVGCNGLCFGSPVRVSISRVADTVFLMLAGPVEMRTSSQLFSSGRLS